MIRSIFRLPAAMGLLAAALAFGWQGLTVHVNYGGNWTALFCVGEKSPAHPPWASQGLYLFPGSTGYDGEFYRIIAHDPFQGQDATSYIDAPCLRFRRILMPMAAWLLAGGQSSYIDAAYLAINLLFVGLGAWWLSRYAVLTGHHAAWGFAFLVVPAVIVSLDRLVVDGALAALTIGFVLYIRTNERWKLYGVLMAAALLRETGIILAAGLCLSLLLRRRFREVVLFGSAVLPAFVWYVYVYLNISPSSSELTTWVPSWGAIGGSLAPVAYGREGLVMWIVVVADYIAMAGTLAALGLALWVVWHKWFGEVEITELLYVLVTAWIIFSLGRCEPYTYPRLATPVLVLLAIRSFSGVPVLWAAPLVMVSLRVVVQLGPQIFGVVRSVVPGS